MGASALRTRCNYKSISVNDKSVSIVYKNHVPMTLICFQTWFECVQQTGQEFVHHCWDRLLLSSSQRENNRSPQVPLKEETGDKHKNFPGARSLHLESQKGLKRDSVPKRLIADVQTGRAENSNGRDNRWTRGDCMRPGRCSTRYV